MRGHELVTRRDLLPDEPDHPRAEQRYYKLSLGKLIELPHPIPSRSLRRITFVLTNGKRLNEAWEINDLFLGSRGVKRNASRLPARVGREHSVNPRKQSIAHAPCIVTIPWKLFL